MHSVASDFRQSFLDFALQQGVLKFGSFVTKSGRTRRTSSIRGCSTTANRCAGSASSTRKHSCRAASSATSSSVRPTRAYRSRAATRVALAAKGRNLPWNFNRKEAKDHGEGGTIVGAPLAGRVLIIDDVITDGGAKREAIDLIRAHGGTPAAILIALDRQERGRGSESPVQEIEREYGIPVIAIATLADLFTFLHDRADLADHVPKIEAYGKRMASRPDRPGRWPSRSPRRCRSGHDCRRGHVQDPRRKGRVQYTDRVPPDASIAAWSS
jgi:orotate phosphoribosyltransferase